MGLNKILAMTAALSSFMPTEHDWQIKIDACKEEYYASVNLPRKLKKKRRKLLNKEYKFLLTMQNL